MKRRARGLPVLGGVGAAAMAGGSEKAEEREGGGGERERTVGVRKKGTASRLWLRIDEEGRTEALEADKYAIMRRVAIPARDLRILDPLLSYPSTVLGREKAIVVNLEHIKGIITAEEVLLLNWQTAEVEKLVEDFKNRLPLHFNALGEQMAGEVGAEGPQRRGPNALPFEFRALEVCLETACGLLDRESARLEQEAYPALEELTATISTLNLERVRQIKSRLVTISGRVQKVRDELEQLLDDDEDMREMYLTDKRHVALSPASSEAAFEAGEETGGSVSSAHPAHLLDDIEPPASRPFFLEPPSDAPEVRFAPLAPQGLHVSGLDPRPGAPSPSSLFAAQFRSSLSGGRAGSRGSSPSSAAGGTALDVEDLEMLLEAYFVQIEGSLNKLSTLREYVDDTEDYINLMLDDKQNSLLQMNVRLTTATLFVSVLVVATGVFGMNVPLPLFKEGSGAAFYWVVGAGAAACLALHTAVILYVRRRGLLG